MNVNKKIAVEGCCECKTKKKKQNNYRTPCNQKKKKNS